jgi:hypothetical protein
MASDSFKRLHQPGEQVPTTGIYRVLHQAHRPSHEVILVVADIFPACQHCGDRVRFELLRPTDQFSEHAEQ